MPESAAYRHHVEPGRDQCRGVRMSERMESDARQLPRGHHEPPIPAKLIRRVGRALCRGAEHKIIVTEPAEPERKPQFKLGSTVYAQDLNHVARQADGAAPVASLRRLEAQAGAGLFETALHAHDRGVKVDGTPRQ